MATILDKNAYILDDEKNPEKSKSTMVHLKTSIDQVYDPLTVNGDSLRTILDRLKSDILSGGVGNLVFPVTSVNGNTGDVVISKNDIGLDQVTNISEEDRELNDNQRNSVQAMIEAYEFTQDNSLLLNHIADQNNPHNISIDTLNQNNNLTNFIQSFIDSHNADGTSHGFQSRLTQIENSITSNNRSIESNIDNVRGALISHETDNDAHAEVLRHKENISDRTDEFSEGSSNNYPSTLGVVNYVENRLDRFYDESNIPLEWISGIDVVNTIDNLPSPSASNEHMMFFVRQGTSNHEEVYICKKNNDGYYYERKELPSITKYNPEHFISTNEGLSLNPENISTILLSEGSVSERFDNVIADKLRLFMGNYVNEDDVNNRIEQITIIPGDMDGCIRIKYDDGENSLISDNVRVTGLQNLAFKEKAGESDIEPISINEHHIQNRAVQNRHLDDQVVEARNLKLDYNCIYGNFTDYIGKKAEEVTLSSFAKLITPYIAAEIEMGNLEENFEDLIRRIVEETLLDTTMIPGGTASGGGGSTSGGGSSTGGGTVVEGVPVVAWMIGEYVGFNHNEALPPISIDENNDIWFTPDGTDPSNYLEDCYFEIDPENGNLYFVSNDPDWEGNARDQN